MKQLENQNISDLIEEYLKQVLAEKEKIEIRRSEMAHQFNCVPSQINYVINTRFTLPKGYIVESKRGGGGYIRIMKIRLSDHDQLLALGDEVIGKELSQKDALSLVQKFYEERLITKREGNIMLAAMSKQALEGCSANAESVRAEIMKTLIQRLGYEEE